ncbi:hypothetical protein C8J56DRAFT_976905 [Mycena floridula]|nr:hypothetical protein C8J56DRAFT_976905 [Mycena floridula]
MHCIPSHRLFGTVKPKTLLEVLNVTMPGVSDPDMEKLIASKGGPSKRGQITIIFSEKKPKKGGWFLFLGEEEALWEEWVISIESRQPRVRERQTFDAALNQTLPEAFTRSYAYLFRNRESMCSPYHQCNRYITISIQNWGQSWWH